MLNTSKEFVFPFDDFIIQLEKAYMYDEFDELFLKQIESYYDDDYNEDYDNDDNRCKDDVRMKYNINRCAVMHGSNDNSNMIVLPEIKRVISNDPATVVFWNDGTKTVVKADREKFDKEKGLAMAIIKKLYGNKGSYFNLFRQWLGDCDK